MKLSGTWGRAAFLTIVTFAGSGCPRRSPGAPPADLEAVREAMSRFRAFALEPARQPPPNLDLGWVGPPGARARLVLPEETDWNRWPGRELRLFNDRWAWLAEFDVEGAWVGWDPERTLLELNDEDHVVPAAPHPDVVLGDLIFWALEQERAALGEDLAARTRAAGPFREAWVHAGTDRFTGIVAFPAGEQEGLHVVAARLTLALLGAEGEERELVWVFQ